jgi:putative peptide zinc metalloprotease protein
MADHPALAKDVAGDARTSLSAVPGFSDVGSETIDSVVEAFRSATATPGEVLIEQSAPPAGFFLMLHGRVEVTDGSGDDRILLNVLGAGSTFGAMSFVDSNRSANANVVAAERVSYLTIDADQFEALLEANPELAQALAADRWSTLKANFLAHTTAFSDLDAGGRRSLAEKIKTVRVEAGQTIVNQGEPGKACYLLAAGSADVLVAAPDGTTSTVATLGKGQLIGEGALLTQAPRNATVQMTTAGTVLVLDRETLLDAVGGSGEVTTELVGLLRMRWRPRQREGVEIHERGTPDGDTIVVLEDKSRGSYYRLAPDGLFIWNRLDGQTTLREIAMAYVVEYKRFDPERVAVAVKGLVDAGFAETAGLRADVAETQKPKGLAAGSMRALKALSVTKAVDDVDGFFARLDRIVGWWAFSRIGVAVMIAISIAGIVASFTSGPRNADFLTSAGSVPLLLLALIPANAIGAVLHEGAHGLAVKRFGRRVKRAGIGWYVITPVAFVDTSDMWLESRWRRALVSIAGPGMNVVLGGACALGAATIDSPLASALLWQSAIVSYYLAAINLNPLLEFDGYYILSDLLDRPNLRDDALKWLGSEFPKALRKPRLFKGHGVDMVYGFFAAVYMALIIFLIIVVYRTLIEHFIAGIVPQALASALAWVLAGGLSALLFFALSAQMRGLNAPRH